MTVGKSYKCQLLVAFSEQCHERLQLETVAVSGNRIEKTSVELLKTPKAVYTGLVAKAETNKQMAHG